MKRLLRKLVVPGAATVFWVVVLLHITPVVPWMIGQLSDRWEDPSGDVLIVPGGDQLGDGTLGMGSYWRALGAVRTWRAGKCKRIVFSGGKLGYPSSQSLAAEMKSFSIGLGVPAEIIEVEERSYSTRENALFTADMVRSWPGSKVLMTSDTHMFRCRRAFERAGLTVRPSPVPDWGKRWSRWSSRWECIWAVAGELTKLAYYRARGWA